MEVVSILRPPGFTPNSQGLLPGFMRLFSATEVSARAEVASMLHKTQGQDKSSRRASNHHRTSSQSFLSQVGVGVSLPTNRALSEVSSFSRGKHGARILSDRVEVEGMAGIGSFPIMNYADHSGLAQLSPFDNCGRSGRGLC